MDRSTRDIVDDFIHETYLDRLDEKAILKDLERFSEICGKVISETIQDGSKIVELNRRLTSIRQKQMLSAADEGEDDPPWSSTPKRRVSRARRVVRNKRLILSAIHEISPGTADRIRCSVHPSAQTGRRSARRALPAPGRAPEIGEQAEESGPLKAPTSTPAFSTHMMIALALVVLLGVTVLFSIAQ